MFDSRKSRGGYTADVTERKPQSRADPGAIDAAIAAERSRVAKLVATKIGQSQSGLAEAIARLLDEESERTGERVQKVRDEAVRLAVEQVVAEARTAVADDVRRFAKVSADLFDQRRRALLMSIDDLAKDVRNFSNPAELVGAAWLHNADLDNHQDTAARALLPSSWGGIIYESGGKAMSKLAPTKLTLRMSTRKKRPARPEDAFRVRRADKERAVVGCVST